MVLRQCGLADAVNAQSDLHDLPVRIVGTRDAGSGVVGFESVLHLTTTVREEVLRVLKCGELPLLVGGCCSFIIGAIAAARDVALLGYRDLEDARSKGSVMPEYFGGDLYLADDVSVIARRPSAVGQLVRQSMEQGPRRFWIHLDFDVLNDQVFPAVDYLSPGGLNWPQLIALLKPLVSSDGLIGMSLACYNPDRDPGYRYAREAVDALRQVFTLQTASQES